MADVYLIKLRTRQNILPPYYPLSSLILPNFFPCFNLNSFRKQDRRRIRPSSPPNLQPCQQPLYSFSGILSKWKTELKIIPFWIHRFFSQQKILTLIRNFNLILDFSKETHPKSIIDLSSSSPSSSPWQC